MSILQIDGLTKRQKALADILWGLDSPDDVNNFILALPLDQQREARTVMNLMIWAMLDQVNDTNLAAPILEKYKL
jgi:hypothetical protein